MNKLGDKDSNGFMVISDYIPNEKASTIGKYSVRVVNRKTSDGNVCKPVYVINAGSKFAGKVVREVVGARALWVAAGMKQEQFGKPIIAIVNSFTQFVPGHTHLHEIGQIVKKEKMSS